MHNQDFGPLKYMLLPFTPLIWWMNRQSDEEVFDEIAYYQDLESGSIYPNHDFIALEPEEILYGESDYYEAYQHGSAFQREFLRAVMEYDIEVDVEVIEGMLRTPLQREHAEEPVDEWVLAYQG
jgi:hypothetical protein